MWRRFSVRIGEKPDVAGIKCGLCCATYILNLVGINFSQSTTHFTCDCYSFGLQQHVRKRPPHFESWQLSLLVVAEQYRVQLMQIFGTPRARKRDSLLSERKRAGCRHSEERAKNVTTA